MAWVSRQLSLLAPSLVVGLRQDGIGRARIALRQDDWMWPDDWADVHEAFEDGKNGSTIQPM